MDQINPRQSPAVTEARQANLPDGRMKAIVSLIRHRRRQLDGVSVAAGIAVSGRRRRDSKGMAIALPGRCGGAEARAAAAR